MSATAATAASKVTASHLARTAYLYVRQSTLRQVVSNTESTQRQYALRQRAVALGWPTGQIVVIDQDQGRSGASATDREGFQRLVAEVGMGRAGIVLGLEVSRLARNNADWHRLLEICALSETLILDEDGLYDPGEFNDRLLLGLKGQMSEAELHFLRARLRGGILSKARRGELPLPLPVGLVDDPAGKVALDPDQGVQQALRHLFATFERTGSARAVVQAFNQEGLRFPARVRSGKHKGKLVWMPLRHWRVLRTLHNPRYAGAFVYGRRRARRTAEGKTTLQELPREQWTALIPDAHPGYISWEQFERNQRLLAGNAHAYAAERAAGPAREGPALLQGLLVCGRCGRRMTVRYHQRHGALVPDYQCIGESIQDGVRRCQTIPGHGVDVAIGQLLLDTVTPLALEVALTVQAELEARADETDQLRRSHVERAKQRAELARRRYLAVDPDNRLVADTLEADWNDALRAGLRWADVDINAQRLHVRRRLYHGIDAPKSRYGRRDIPLAPRMLAALQHRRATTPYAAESDPVFATRAGTPLDYACMYNRVLKPAARRAAVPWAAFHTLRHTCATMLFRNGLNAKQVQMWLGHHSPAFTLAVYVHLLTDDLPDPSFLDTLTQAPDQTGAEAPAFGEPAAVVDLVRLRGTDRRSRRFASGHRKRQLRSQRP